PSPAEIETRGFCCHPKHDPELDICGQQRPYRRCATLSGDEESRRPRAEVYRRALFEVVLPVGHRPTPGASYHSGPGWRSLLVAAELGEHAQVFERRCIPLRFAPRGDVL